MARTVLADKLIARKYLELYVQQSIPPELTTGEIIAVLDSVQRCTFWEADTAYSVGQVVMPTVPNGHRYVCITAGTSGATEPESWALSPHYQTSDGDDLVWQEAGHDYPNVFDLDAALYQGWMTKAAKASQEVDATLAGGSAAGTMSAKCSQQYLHCIEMARQYAPFAIS